MPEPDYSVSNLTNLAVGTDREAFLYAAKAHLNQAGLITVEDATQLIESVGEIMAQRRIEHQMFFDTLRKLQELRNQAVNFVVTLEENIDVLLESGQTWGSTTEVAERRAAQSEERHARDSAKHQRVMGEKA